MVGSVVGWLFSDKKSGNPRIHPEIQWFILIVFIKTVTCAMVKTCFIVTGDGQKSIRGSCVQGKDDGMIMPHIQVPCFDHRPHWAHLAKHRSHVSGYDHVHVGHPVCQQGDG